MSVLAAVLIVLGTALYLVVREQLLNGIDNGVRLMAAKATEKWTSYDQIPNGPSSGPYTVNFLPILGTSTRPHLKSPTSEAMHVDIASMEAAYTNPNGSDLRSSGSSGDRERVYSVRVTAPDRVAVIQVTRSTEPEHEALSKLLAGLLIGGAGGLVLAGVGGWWLAGKSLRPVRVAFNRQHAFVSDASHELRTPLAVIAANLEVAQRKPRDVAHWQQVANNTLTEVRRMTMLVDKLLVLSRSGADGLHRRREDLHALAAAAVERAGPAASEHEIMVSVAPGPAVHAEVDAAAMAIVFDNLLRNAIDHSPRRQAVVVAIAGAPAPLIHVEDSGPGVPVDVRVRIFEPFMRGPHPATDRASGPGFGLGLAICKRIVDGHGGTIGVEDRPGGGARFVVALKPG
jgi:signal transduction histidine kinase